MSLDTLAVSKNTKEYRYRKPEVTAHITVALKITTKHLKGYMIQNNRKNMDF